MVKKGICLFHIAASLTCYSHIVKCLFNSLWSFSVLPVAAFSSSSSIARKKKKFWFFVWQRTLKLSDNLFSPSASQNWSVRLQPWYRLLIWSWGHPGHGSYPDPPAPPVLGRGQPAGQGSRTRWERGHPRSEGGRDARLCGSHPTDRMESPTESVWWERQW